MKEEKKKVNIEGIHALRKEWENGRMDERKLVALRNKLIELYVGNIANDDEKSLAIDILKRDRSRGRISDFNMELLNRNEINKCKESCFVKIDSAPVVHHLKKHQVCRFFRDVENERYVVFVEREIPTSFQMTEDLIKREERGHFPKEEEYPKPRKLLHRLDLKAREFNAWFEIEDEGILKPQIEEKYTF